MKEKGAEKSVGREEVLHGIKIVQVFFIRKKVSYDIPSVYPPDTRRVSWELRKKKSHRAFQKCNNPESLQLPSECYVFRKAQLTCL